MSRGKLREGVCGVCGNFGKLSYEHYPPEAAFNDVKLNIYSADTIQKSGKLPWELDGLKYNQKQRGLGDFILCENCNNNFGGWYADEYSRFSAYILSIFRQVKVEDAQLKNKAYIFSEIKDFKALNFIKQVVSIFCCIAPKSNFGKDFREFLLNKESNSFNKKKYRISMFAVTKGAKIIPISVIGKKTANGFTSHLISEFFYPPLGFVLEVDPKEDCIKGVDITSFVDCNYNETYAIEIELPVVESSSWIPCDYRSKDEIVKCVEINRRMR